MGLFGWRTKKNGDHYQISESPKRDYGLPADDNENPVTFADAIDDKELNEFAAEKKEEFQNTYDSESGKSEVTFGSAADEKMWEEVEDAIKEIENDKNLTLDDKIILLYNIFDEYGEGIPNDLKQRILIDLESLDKKLREKKEDDKITSTEQKLHDKITKLKSRLDVEKLRTKKIPTKSTDNLSPEKSREARQVSKETREEWDELASALLIEAESV